MTITVRFPPELGYRGTASWFLEEGETWTVADLCADICYAARADGFKLQLGGVDLDPDSLAVDVLGDGAEVDLVGVP